MKIYVTKFAATSGIKEFDVTMQQINACWVNGNILLDGNYYYTRHVFKDLKEAVIDAQNIISSKINKLNKKSLQYSEMYEKGEFKELKK